METKKEILKELINPDTFAFQKDSEYGKGAPSTPSEISSNSMTDKLARMTLSSPSPNVTGSGVGNSYLGEDSIYGKQRKERDNDVLKGEKEDDKILPSSLQRKIEDIVDALADTSDNGTRLHTGKEFFNALVEAAIQRQIANQESPD